MVLIERKLYSIGAVRETYFIQCIVDFTSLFDGYRNL
jgi:hypothetical protein